MAPFLSTRPTPRPAGLGEGRGAAFASGCGSPDVLGGEGPRADSGPHSDCPGSTSPRGSAAPPPGLSSQAPVCLATEEARRFPETAVRLGRGLQLGCRKRWLGLQHPPTSHAPTGLTSAPASLSFAAPSSRAPSPIAPPARSAHNHTSLDHILSSGSLTPKHSNPPLEKLLFELLCSSWSLTLYVVDSVIFRL